MIGAAHIEPMLPELNRGISDRILALLEQSALLGAHPSAPAKSTQGEFVRVTDAHFSNLIEGHDTPVADIERALKGGYSDDPKTRDLQMEAVAHVEVQRMIDQGWMPFPPLSVDGIRWIHQEFCSRLSDSFLEIEDPSKGTMVRVTPGELRSHHVGVGRHLAPEPGALPELLDHFVQAYSSPMLDSKQRILVVPASHHRLLWIHPFADANGRVARLFSHALLKEFGLGSELWPLSRGLALEAVRYKQLLQAADEPRRGDLDGRGSLTEAGLSEFCAFFLDVCTDQIESMSG